MIDILVSVSCRFEMYIFKIAHVINENVRIAFLYVLSICGSSYVYGMPFSCVISFINFIPFSIQDVLYTQYIFSDN